ncbi:MAG: GNAT family N-acetyltransferase [Candidatus Bathyarchaeota archaeon]
MPKIRGFRPGDAPRLAEIAGEAFADEAQRGMPAFTEEYFTRRGDRPGVRLVVAEEGGEVAGFMLLTDATVEAPAQVHLVAVEASRRNREIGRTLVGYAVDLLGACGWGKLKLSTRPWNTGMRRVCEALGFTLEAYLRGEYLGEDLVQYGYFPERP